MVGGSARRGRRTELAVAGITPPPELPGDWSAASGYRNGLILARVPDATAVFVASDEMAFGVIRGLVEHGRRVPENVSVTSDDIPLAAYCSPPLTTIAQPFRDIGRIAVEHLLRTISDPGAVTTDQAIEPTLVIRESTAAPGA
ncbi:substrate-binding domain-containing protein [Rathayibacter sp. KR2-224]|uniref:substrate-binding domain-containing protein n=1 Tax=Rathayibacter sp. KR2-224 TaxID=3400913 RepID=UPI003C04538B